MDFGSQYTQLIARRIRECHVYCEIHEPTVSFDAVRAYAPDLVILSGGPDSVVREGSPRLGFSYKKFEDLGVSVVGICYGMQLMAQELGGKVARGRVAEYGFGSVTWKQSDLLSKIKKREGETQNVWLSHGDQVVTLPPGFSLAASTSDVPATAMVRAGVKRMDVGLQFHPEVSHTEKGAELLRHLLFDVGRCKPDWKPRTIVEHLKEEIRKRVGDDGHVVMGLSGGVDSTVAAVLIHQVIGKRLHCLFVDHGLCRAGEREQVMRAYDGLRLQVEWMDAEERFLKALRGEKDPEKKRKIIGHEFIYCFRDWATKKHPECAFLGQGTLYPDVIESKSTRGPSHTIKSHHNVGGLPKDMPFQLIEPLSELFKDEVRLLGAELGISKELLGRHPFPGPGLAVRILGEVTKEKLELLRQADRIFIESLRSAGLYDKIWQALVVLTDCHSVGVKGDARAYGPVVALRAVTSTDGMTADWYPFDGAFLKTVSSRILNEVRDVTRVVYDISSKPPATIEWE